MSYRLSARWDSASGTPFIDPSGACTVFTARFRHNEAARRAELLTCRDQRITL